ncbi:SDR family oxidoreductase [Nocardiopsis sp. CNT-189]|uniref:SDR family NAD(P)-dependent oxidoreductase n=1 Tax=Nocardiopsis oceanisediminis TaxID=2816862 RepID=UPI003B29464E
MADGALAGRTAVVTGAGPGLGRTLALLLAEEGARVVVSARSAETLDAIAGEVAARGGEALPLPADVTDDRAVRGLAAEVDDRFGGADVLVNAAFPGSHRQNVLDMGPEDLQGWRHRVDTAVYGTLLCCRRIAPQMVRKGAGAIVNLTSMSSRSAYAGRSDYAAGKAGVHLLSQSLADELGPHGVRVNCVAPGWIESPVLRDWMAARAADEGTTYQEIRDRDVRRMALRRIATEEDVARAVLFLAGDASAATTGAVIDVNAGQYFG